MSYFLVLWLFLSLFSLRALSPTFGFSLSILGNLGFVFFLIKDLFFVYLDNLLFTRFEIINFFDIILFLHCAWLLLLEKLLFWNKSYIYHDEFIHVMDKLLVFIRCLFVIKFIYLLLLTLLMLESEVNESWFMNLLLLFSSFSLQTNILISWSMYGKIKEICWKLLYHSRREHLVHFRRRWKARDPLSIDLS